MKTIVILMILISLGACKKSGNSGSSKNPTPPPNNPIPIPKPPTPEPPEPSILPPTINEITSVQKSYRSGSEVEFVVILSKAVEVSEGNTPFLSLNIGSDMRQANFRRGSGENDKKISFFYEVQPNDNDNDGVTLAPTLDLNGGSIRDTSGQDLVNTIPQEHRNFPNVKVDTIHPTISSVATVSGSTFGPNGIVDLVATFNEPVKMTGVPSLTLSVGGSPVSANYQDKGEGLNLTHTFRYIVGEGHSGSIQVTGLSVDSSNSIRDEAENLMEENIQTSLSVSGVTVETEISCAYTVASGFQRGDGSKSSPYLICAYAQLNKMRDNLTAYYELGQDIDASPSWSAGTNGCTAYDGSTVPETTPCTGWVPIGTFEANNCNEGTDDVCFQGHLDGGDHIISNLYINISGSGTKYGGLFGYTGSQAEISHIGLTDASVTATTINSVLYVGGLVGRSTGGTIINNSYATGTITTSSTSSPTSSTSSTYYQSYVGGLVGYIGSGTISNSYATGTITSSSSSSSSSTYYSSYVSGLVGYISGGTINNSYATGTITSSSSNYSYVGGLVGQSIDGETTINNSYATGTITSSSPSTYVGNLVGHNSQGTISNSYATGAIISFSTASYGGGLVGYNYYGSISNSYATGTITPISSQTYGGGLIGRNENGTISGTNYFVDSYGGTNGINIGTCSGNCTQKTLVELQALISTDVTDWNTDNWDFGTTTQLPRLKYVPTATYCSDTDLHDSGKPVKMPRSHGLSKDVVAIPG